MWYFTWILGTALACSFAILNGLWFELKLTNQPNKDHESSQDLS